MDGIALSPVLPFPPEPGQTINHSPLILFFNDTRPTERGGKQACISGMIDPILYYSKNILSRS